MNVDNMAGGRTNKMINIKILAYKETKNKLKIKTIHLKHKRNK